MRTGLLTILGLLLITAAGCGGGGDESAPPPPPGPTITAFSADRPSYWIGDQARLTVTFSNGTGRLEPDGIVVTSGQTVTTPILSTPVQYRLLVTDGSTTVSRNLDLAVSYRDRLRAVPMPFARGEHSAVRLSDDRVLIIGGEDNGNAFPSAVFAFNPGPETFTPFAELSTGRTGFIALALYDGDVLIAGGERGVTGTPGAEVINHLTGAVTATRGAPVRVRHHAAATLLMDGRVFIAGGRVSAGADNTAEIYDPATGTFTLLPGTMQVGRSLHTVTRIDQRRLLIYGGLTAGSQQAPPEIYDVVAGTSTLLTSPETGVRANHEAITLQDGGVLIIGGEDYDQAPLASVLRFDPGSGTFASYATLATPRSAAAVNRLVDGRVFIAGGVTGVLSSDATDTTELLTETAQRRDGPGMSARRRDLTVTRLNSGKLLIVGGLGTNLLPLASAEIYE
jgi:hypothetical protein